MAIVSDCNVCGYPNWNAKADACPQCGTDYEVSFTRNVGQEMAAREAWASAGFPWLSTLEPAPKSWTPEQGLWRLENGLRASGKAVLLADVQRVSLLLPHQQQTKEHEI